MSQSKSVRYGQSEIEQIVSRMGLDDSVTQFSKALLEQWAKESNIQSRPAEVHAAACVTITLKQQQLPYTLRNVVKNTDFPERFPEEFDDPESALMRHVGRAETDMIRRLGLEDIIPSSPEDYTEDITARIFEKIDVEESVADDIADLATELVLTAQEYDDAVFSGNSPSTVAASAVWIASRLHGTHVNQDIVEDVVDTSSVAIRSRAQDIVNALYDYGINIDEYKQTEELDSRIKTRVENARYSYRYPRELEYESYFQSKKDYLIEYDNEISDEPSNRIVGKRTREDITELSDYISELYDSEKSEYGDDVVAASIVWIASHSTGAPISMSEIESELRINTEDMVDVVTDIFSVIDVDELTEFESFTLHFSDELKEYF